MVYFIILFISFYLLLQISILRWKHRIFHFQLKLSKSVCTASEIVIFLLYNHNSLVFLEAIQRIINLNSNSEQEDKNKENGVVRIWKILILDDFSKRIVAPLLDTSQLKRLGITLTYTIKQHRNPVYSVPAIYFLQPHIDNINAICDVCHFSL